MKNNFFKNLIEIDPTWENLFSKLYKKFFIAGFLLITTISFFKIKPGSLNFGGWYSLISACLCCLILGFLNPYCADNKTPVLGLSLKEKIIDFGRVGLLFFGSLVIKFIFISVIPLWGDEITQYVLTRKYDPINAAFIQQQPLLGYYFSTLMIGPNQFTVRLPVIICSSLALVIFYFFLRTFKIGHPLAIASSLCLFLTPLFFQYSLEARPIQLLFIMLFFYFYELITSFIRPALNWRSGVRLVAAGFMLTLTIGFQPVILVITVAVMTAPFIYINRSLQLKIILPQFLIILLFLPVHREISKHSIGYLTKHPTLASVFTDLIEFSQRISFFSLNLRYTAFLLIFGGLIFWLRTIVFEKHTRVNTWTEWIKDKNCKLALVILAGATLFYSIAFFAFALLVSWHLADRYVAVNCFLFLILITILTDVIIRTTQLKLKPTYHTQALLFSLLTFIGIFYFLNKPFFSYGNRHDRLNAPAYESIVSRLEPGDVILPICRRDFFCWDYPYFIEFYTQKDFATLPREIVSPFTSIVNQIRQNITKNTVYLLINHELDENGVRELAQFSPLFFSDRISTYKLSGENKWDQLERILSFLKTNNDPRQISLFHETYFFGDIPILLARKKSLPPLPGPITLNFWEFIELRSIYNIK